MSAGNEKRHRFFCSVKFRGVVYVLHAFQKKSTHGIATTQHDIDLIKQRLMAAEQDFKARGTEG